MMSRMEIIELQDSFLREAQALAEVAKNLRESGRSEETYCKIVEAMSEAAKGAKALQDVLDNGPGWAEKR